jgi:hypothetical protein
MMDINKFEALVEDVRGRIERKFDTFNDKSMTSIGRYKKYNQMERTEKSVLNRGKFNIALVLLFDYDELNDYAKTIVDKTQAFFLNNKGSDYKLNKKLTIGKYEIPETFDEYKRKGFIEELLLLKENEDNEPEFFRLIFWALMIMAVDKKTAAKKLQDICEYSKLFGFDEKNVLFIFKMINVVLGNKKAKKYNVDMIARMMFDNDFKNMELIDKLQGDLEDIFNHYH